MKKSIFVILSISLFFSCSTKRETIGAADEIMIVVSYYVLNKHRCILVGVLHVYGSCIDITIEDERKHTNLQTSSIWLISRFCE